MRDVNANSVTKIPASVFPLSNQQRANTARLLALSIASREASVLSRLGQPLSENSAVFDIIDLIKISPAAQNELDFFSLLNGVHSNNLLGDASILKLTDEQETKFNDTIIKYKDAPFDSITYAKILEDLTAAGLSEAQLSIQNSVVSFGLSEILINAILGQSNRTNFFNLFNNPIQEDNTNGYTQQVIREWENTSNKFSGSVINSTLLF